MERSTVYETEQLLFELKNSNAPQEIVQKLQEIFEPMFVKEREKEYKEKLEIDKFSWNCFNPQRQMQTVVSTLNSIITFHQEAKLEEDKYHDATQDLLHAFELTDPSDEEIINLGKELIALRRQRRKTKDFLMLTEPLFNFVIKNRNLVKELGQVQGEMTKITQTLNGRRYYTKEKTSLQEAFDQAKERQSGTLVTA